MVETTIFKCPACGAPLELPSGKSIMKCTYCNNSVVVPNALTTTEIGGSESLGGVIKSLQRGNKVEAIQIFRELTGADLSQARFVVDAIEQGKAVEITDLLMSELAGGRSLGELDAEGRIPPSKLDQAQETFLGKPYQAQQPRRHNSLALFMAVIGLLIAGVLFAVFFNLRSQGTSGDTSSIIEQILPSPTPSFANPVLSFGEEGMGAGMLNDPRAIGVDRNGNIYVGDYSDGRIQIFDAQGNFLKLINLGSYNYIASLVVAPDGTFFACASGKILHFDSYGEELKTPIYATPSNTSNYFENIALGADGSLYATAGQETIFRFAQDGTINLTIQDAFKSVTNDSELDMHLAVDGLRNIYVLGTFNNIVLKYSPEGKYLDRFGGETQHPAEGVDPGRFQAPDTLAVDGYGRIYVSDIWGIQVFDANGQYLDFFKIDGVAFGMAFGLENDLYIASSTPKILKYQIQKP
jgi:LSD1 subclass zinc finger protein